MLKQETPMSMVEEAKMSLFSEESTNSPSGSKINFNNFPRVNVYEEEYNEKGEHFKIGDVIWLI
jgi:hypothetical protein